MLQKNQKSNP